MKKSIFWGILIFLNVSCHENDVFSKNCNSIFIVDDTNLQIDSVYSVRPDYSEVLWVTKRYFLDSQILNVTCIDTLLNQNNLKHFRFNGILYGNKNKYLLKEKIFKMLVPPLPASKE